MKVLHITNNLIDGAGRAVMRLHKGMLNIGIDSYILVQSKSVEDERVIDISSSIKYSNEKTPLGNFYTLLIIIVKKVLLRYLNLRWKFHYGFNRDLAFSSFDIIKLWIKEADFICLHSTQFCLSTGMIRKISKISSSPLVWTLMDVEPITGGCHFNNSCQEYSNKCGSCPQIRMGHFFDLSRRIFSRKLKSYAELPMAYVCGSQELVEKAKMSPLSRKRLIKKIILSVDSDIFKPGNIEEARLTLGLPLNKKIVLFGCFDLSDYRKGGELLVQALTALPKTCSKGNAVYEDLVLLTIGNKNNFQIGNTNIEWIHYGSVQNDDVLAKIYQSVDVYACPSIDDSGPMMINEAFMCQTPIVSFANGVAPDLICHGQNGYIAEYLNVKDFSKGLSEYLSTGFDKSKFLIDKDTSLLCHPSRQASEYLDLFNQLKLESFDSNR